MVTALGAIAYFIGFNSLIVISLISMFIGIYKATKTMENKLKVFRIDCEGVIYHVSGEDRKSAEDHLEKCEIEWNGYLEVPRHLWKTTSVTKPFLITYDEKEEDGTPIEIMSDELVSGQRSPEVLSCSEWI